METLYYVLDEEVLGYTYGKPKPDGLGTLWVLRNLSGVIHLYSVSIPVDLTRLRPATVADFERFRVCHTGYNLQGSNND